MIKYFDSHFWGCVVSGMPWGFSTSCHLSSSETQRRKCIQSLLFRPCQWWLSTSVRKYTGPLGFAKWYTVTPLKFNIKNNSKKVWKGVRLFIAIMFSIDSSDPYGERLSFGGWVLKQPVWKLQCCFSTCNFGSVVSLVAVVDIFLLFLTTPRFHSLVGMFKKTEFDKIEN